MLYFCCVNNNVIHYVQPQKETYKILFYCNLIHFLLFSVTEVVILFQFACSYFSSSDLPLRGLAVSATEQCMVTVIDAHKLVLRLGIGQG